MFSFKPMNQKSEDRDYLAKLDLLCYFAYQDKLN